MSRFDRLNRRDHVPALRPRGRFQQVIILLSDRVFVYAVPRRVALGVSVPSVAVEETVGFAIALSVKSTGEDRPAFFVEFCRDAFIRRALTSFGDLAGMYTEGI